LLPPPLLLPPPVLPEPSPLPVSLLYEEPVGDEPPLQLDKKIIDNKAKLNIDTFFMFPPFFLEKIEVNIKI